MLSANLKTLRVLLWVETALTFFGLSPWKRPFYVLKLGVFEPFGL